jgi:hypothetical protein
VKETILDVEKRIALLFNNLNHFHPRLMNVRTLKNDSLHWGGSKFFDPQVY